MLVKKQVGKYAKLGDNHIAYLRAMIGVNEGANAVKELTGSLRCHFSELKDVARSTVWKVLRRKKLYSKKLASKRTKKIDPDYRKSRFLSYCSRLCQPL